MVGKRKVESPEIGSQRVGNLGIGCPGIGILVVGSQWFGTWRRVV